MCDRSALFLLWFVLCCTNHPFLNGRRYRSYKSTNWPGKCDSWLNLLSIRRDVSYPPLHLRLTYKVAGILFHSTCHYPNKDVLFITCIPRGWTHTGYAITDSFLHRNLPKRRRMKRHKRPCFCYPNSSAAFNMELIGNLMFKLNPGPFMNRTIPVIVSSQAKRSHGMHHGPLLCHIMSLPVLKVAVSGE